MSWDEFWQGVSGEEYIAKSTLHDRLLIKYLSESLARISAPAGGSACTILEIGCVYSKNLRQLPQVAGSGTVFLGLDSCIEPALETGRLNPHLNVHVIVGSLFTPPLPETSIDLIISFGLIEHFPDPREFLEACWNLLRPGGRLVVGYPSFLGLTGLIQRLVNPQAFDHHFSLSAEEMLSRMAELGFSEVESRYFSTFNPNMINWGSGWIRKMLMYSAFILILPVEWAARLTGMQFSSKRFSSYVLFYRVEI